MNQTPQPNDAPIDNDAENPPDSDGKNQARIDQLLDRWEATYEAGSPLPVETLCKEEPELIPKIRQRVAALKEVDAKLARRKKTSGKTLPSLQIAALVNELKFLNAGGLGEVYVGQDESLHRRVAVKFMHAHLSDHSERRGQFALEAEITGRLEHPGIVPLYGFGNTQDDRPFYAMRYIEGDTLDEAIKTYFKKLDDVENANSSDSQGPARPFNPEIQFRRLLGNFVSVCKTIAYAHNRGVVHRDIKPANIMIGRFGETIVVDWGLAVPVLRDERFRVSGEETLALSPSGSQSGSMSGRGSGTPAFMSPEQFSELAPTPANDIYSLGATLFVILSGKPPIRNQSLTDIRSDTLEGKLPDLNQIRRGIPKQLQAIVYKAMKRDASDRYPTALDLARDIERYLADEPVSAYKDSVGLRVARLARRHRSATQAAVLGLIGCLVIAGFSFLLMKGLANRADTLRDHNLSTSAQFIARACGYEIDRVWRVLEYEANSPKLQKYVMAANELIASGEEITLTNQKELQFHLQERLDRLDHVPTVDRIFVLTKTGTQIARAPKPETPQVGENFAYRDYFTGLGFDLEPGSKIAKLITEPLAGPAVYPSGVHMSPAYVSTLSNEPMVTLTVPIYITNADGEQEVVGIIGTSVPVGNVMAATKVDDSKTWIGDLREDKLEGQRKRGLILHYPKSTEQTDVQDTRRISNDLVEKLRNPNYDSDGKTLSEEWLTGSDAQCSIQRITISGRASQDFELGWIVVTAESND